MVREEFFDTELKYYSAAVYNVLDTAVCCSIDITLTCLPVIFMGYAVALLEELSKRLTKIGELVKTHEGIEDNAWLTELVECVNLHLKIKEFTRNIEKHFSTIILVQGLMSSIIFCTSIYILSTVI